MLVCLQEQMIPTIIGIVQVLYWNFGKVAHQGYWYLLPPAKDNFIYVLLINSNNNYLLSW